MKRATFSHAVDAAAPKSLKQFPLVPIYTP